MLCEKHLVLKKNIFDFKSDKIKFVKSKETRIKFLTMVEQKKNPVTIRSGRREDASFIGKTITEAMGHELCVGLADGEENLDKVLKLFTDLAATETAQYSYKNALMATDDSDELLGAIIAYDGSLLREMRKDFIAKANELLDWNITVEEADNWEPETNKTEIYLDSLYVKTQFRNLGIATSLIKAAIDKYKDMGKPFGLLVEPNNTLAYKLYKKLGFKEDGTNNFCGEPMLHLSFLPD